MKEATCLNNDRDFTLKTIQQKRTLTKILTYVLK